MAQERRFRAGGFQVRITIKWRTSDKWSGLAESRGQMCGDKVMNGLDERGEGRGDERPRVSEGQEGSVLSVKGTIKRGCASSCY